MPALSANGNTAVVVLNGKNVRCWDLTDSDPKLSVYELPETAIRIALNPGGERLAVATENGRLDLCEATTGFRLHSREQVIRSRLAFSDHQKWLAVTDGQTVTMLDSESCNIVWSVRSAKDDYTKAITISPDCRLVAIAGCRSGINIFNCSTGVLLRHFSPDVAVNSMAFSPSGDRLYLCGSNINSIRVWSVHSGQELKPIEFDLSALM
jgi:WD40 repeat protein